VKSWQSGVRCVVMQGGQGDIKHWAFNDPLKRTGKWKNEPPPPAEYRKLGTRIVDLHPITLAQNARTSGGGNITMVPKMAITVGQKKPGWPRRSASGTPACMTTPSASA
jgi:glucosamine-6-phosphate deaminase